jgi:hypothetical protein
MATLPLMHPFPPATELQFLVGLEVGQICLDPWSTQIRFTNGGQITVVGRLEHVDSQGRSHLHQANEDQERGPVYLRELIQQRITLLQREPSCLALAFTNGSVLRIWSEASPYEDGQIQAHGGRLIVF